jgi:hypothetical protein
MLEPDIEHVSTESRNKNALEQIRKEKLSTFNRLHSIHEDAMFIQEVLIRYNKFPVVGALGIKR